MKKFLSFLFIFIMIFSLFAFSVSASDSEISRKQAIDSWCEEKGIPSFYSVVSDIEYFICFYYSGRYYLFCSASNDISFLKYSDGSYILYANNIYGVDFELYFQTGNGWKVVSTSHFSVAYDDYTFENFLLYYSDYESFPYLSSVLLSLYDYDTRNFIKNTPFVNNWYDYYLTIKSPTEPTTEPSGSGGNIYDKDNGSLMFSDISFSVSNSFAMISPFFGKLWSFNIYTFFILLFTVGMLIFLVMRSIYG